MEKYISILRGINVSGHKLIKMKLLQEMFVSLGFSNVLTYIQSGNVVFECEPGNPERMNKIISEGIMETFGFGVPVLVIRADELRIISENNRFLNQRQEDVAKLHVTFLSEEPDGKLIDGIGKEEYLPDEFYLAGKAVYLFCPGGYGNTKLSNTFFEKKLKVEATTRNWKTILELVRMSG